MAFDSDKTRNWDRQTLNDGDLFESEFERVYANLNDLNQRLTDMLAEQETHAKAIKLKGEKFWLNDLREPSEEFPAFCISKPNQVLSTANWPDLVPLLYDIPLRYDPLTLNITQFHPESWETTSDAGTQTATLTFPAPVQKTGSLTTGSDTAPITGGTADLTPGMFISGVKVNAQGVRLQSTYHVKAVDGSNVTLDRDYAGDRKFTNEDTAMEGGPSVSPNPLDSPDHINETIDFSDPVHRILAALKDDVLVNGSYKNWRTITVPANIGNIPTGTYPITNISPDTFQISFDVTLPGNPVEVGNGSTVSTDTIAFYPHRIAFLTDSVRHFSVQGRAFATESDENREFIGGLRRQDRFQGHKIDWQRDGYDETHQAYQIWMHAPNGLPGVNYHLSEGSQHVTTTIQNQRFQTFRPDGVNGDPRWGRHTEARSEVNFAYLWGGRYIP